MKSSKASRDLEMGFAEVDYTPAPGLPLIGQMHQRFGKYKRDPLMACAMAIRKGKETVVMVSVDIIFMDDPFVRDVQERFARRYRLEGTRLILHATHTHVAPTVKTLITAAANPSFVKRLREFILKVAGLALSRLTPCEIFGGTGYMEHLGWNRRAMFKDGTSVMYGRSDAPGFSGIEGPRDPALPVLFARDRKGKVMGLMVNFATHSNCHELGCFYSADIPGEVRKVVKTLLGSKVVVVHLSGALGNTAPKLINPYDPDQPWMGEKGLIRSGLYMGGEVAKVVASSIRPMESPVLRFAQEEIRVPVRPWPKEMKDPTHPKGSGWDPLKGKPYFENARAEWPSRVAAGPVPFRVNVIRIGDGAICMNPGELFVEFGLVIREISPARVTLIGSLSDGYVGYIPTGRAFLRGGYEVWPAYTSQLDRLAGRKIVLSTKGLLRKCFA